MRFLTPALIATAALAAFVGPGARLANAYEAATPTTCPVPCSGSIVCDKGTPSCQFNKCVCQE